MAKNRRSTGHNTAMNDMLSNIALGFIMLFIIALIMMNPITKRNDIPSKNEFMIVLDWNEESLDDVDLWVQKDNDSAVGFSNRNAGFLNLDRDDLGGSNDSTMIDGKWVINKLNRETINLRGVAAGTYYVMAYMYNRRDQDHSIPQVITITVIDINPYKEIYSIKYELRNSGDLARAPAFTINAQGEVTEVFNHTRSIVRGKDVTGPITVTSDNRPGESQ